MVTLLDQVTTFGEFEDTYERAQGVHMLFLSARTRLRDHIKQHGCEIPDEGPNEALLSHPR
jgi:hypothetical protein